jgi:hypothetical protein
VPARRDPLKRTFEQVQALRQEGPSEHNLDLLKSFLGKHNGMVVARVAALVADWFAVDLCQDLVTCFYRLCEYGQQRDPQSWGKVAIVKALHELAWQDAAVYLAAVKTFQLEPSYTGPQDSAAAVRSSAIQALVQLPHISSETVINCYVDLLADPVDKVRAEALRASIYLPIELVQPLLRLKIRLGDADPRVMGSCFDALLALVPDEESVDIVAGFAASDDQVLESEALAALASSTIPKAIALVREHYAKVVDSQLKRIIITSLGASTSSEAIDFLCEILGQQNETSGWAFEALKAKLVDDEILARAREAGFV